MHKKADFTFIAPFSAVYAQIYKDKIHIYRIQRIKIIFRFVSQQHNRCTTARQRRAPTSRCARRERRSSTCAAAATAAGAQLRSATSRASRYESTGESLVAPSERARTFDAVVATTAKPSLCVASRASPSCSSFDESAQRSQLYALNVARQPHRRQIAVAATSAPTFKDADCNDDSPLAHSVGVAAI